MEKRVLLAVTMSIVVILLYPVILAKINPNLVKQPNQIQPLTKQDVIEKKIDFKTKEAAFQNALPDNAVSFSVSTDKYDLDITNIGGSISKIVVKDAKRNNNLTLVKHAIYNTGFLAVDGKGIFSTISSQSFTIQQDKPTVSLETNRIKIEKTIGFLENRYGIDTVIHITNKTSDIQDASFDITTGSNISKDELYEARYVELDIQYKDGTSKKLKGNNLLASNRFYKDNIDWVALKNKYYVIIAKPDFNAKGVFTKNSSGEPVAGFIAEEDKILPGETKSYGINFYIGPMEIKELEKMDPGFSKVLNFGFLTSISLILLGILQFFYSILHNYGAAILLLTVCQ